MPSLAVSSARRAWRSAGRHAGGQDFRRLWMGIRRGPPAPGRDAARGYGGDRRLQGATPPGDTAGTAGSRAGRREAIRRGPPAPGRDAARGYGGDRRLQGGRMGIRRGPPAPGREDGHTAGTAGSRAGARVGNRAVSGSAFTPRGQAPARCWTPAAITSAWRCGRGCCGGRRRSVRRPAARRCSYGG